jgi:hypothetical protein
VLFECSDLTAMLRCEAKCGRCIFHACTQITLMRKTQSHICGMIHTNTRNYLIFLCI